MKILYGIQTTGNGHLTRSLEIIEELKKIAEVELLLSGPENHTKVPYEVLYRKKGVSISNKHNGNLAIGNTIKNFALRSLAYDISSLDLKPYDLIITDYEPITGWASYLQKKPCIALSNQMSLYSPHSPRPQKKRALFEFFIKNFIPHTDRIGFHYEAYDTFIETPIISNSIRSSSITDKGHIVVYLPHIKTEILLETFKQIPDMVWHIYTKDMLTKTIDNMVIKPIGQEFKDDLLSAHGLICGAGFQATAEALYLGKKLLAIPISWHYEQEYNAAALTKLGIKTLPSLEPKNAESIERWLHNAPIIQMHYPDNKKRIAEKILQMYTKL